MKKTTIICPSCGNIINEPLNLITSYQIKKLPKDIENNVAVDEVIYKHHERYGGLFAESETAFKQVAYNDNDIPEELKNNINGNKLILQIGTDEIDQKACPICHSNITPIYKKDISDIHNILLIGLPGASKTTLITSLFKLIDSDTFTKNERISHGSSFKSYEYRYYKQIADKYPIISNPTTQDGNEFNRQPLFYCRINDKLLIFHDYPGEGLKKSTFYIPDNCIPVYLYDTTQNEDEQLCFFNKTILELHESNNVKMKKEVLAFVKSDMLPDFSKQLMIKSYKSSGFTSFDGLLAARRGLLNDTKFSHQIYDKLKQYGSIVDISCLAALGCSTHEEYINNETSFVLDNTWKPRFLYDFLLTLEVT